MPEEQPKKQPEPYDPNAEYVTVSQAAAALGVAIQTLRNAIAEGRLPVTRIHGRVLVAVAQMEAYRQRTRPDGVKPAGRPRKP